MFFSDVYWPFPLPVIVCTLSSSAHRASPKTDPDNGNKKKTFKRIRVLSCKISEHKESKEQINNKKYKHYTNPWMLRKFD